MRLLTASVTGLTIAATVAVATATAIAPDRWIAPLRSTTTGNAYVQADVTPISPKISGYVAEMPVADYQTVKAGDVLLRIDDRDYRERVNQAAAGVAERRAALENHASRIAQQRAAVAQADAALAGAAAEDRRAELDVERVRELTARNFFSQARLDQAQAEHLRNRAGVAQATAGVAAARRQLDVLQGERPRLLAEVDAALAALGLARLDLENTVVRSPVDGRIGKREARVGQYVRPGSLLIALVPHEYWIIANFKETQISGLEIGDKVSISVDAIPGARFKGRVESLSPASGAQFALLPPDNATGNFTRIVQRIPVKIVFESDQPALDRLRPGMSASVVLEGRAGRRGEHPYTSRQ